MHMCRRRKEAQTRHNSLIFQVWLVDIGVMTHWYRRHDSCIQTWLMLMCRHRKEAHTRHDSLINETWLIDIWGMTRWYMRHHSCTHAGAKRFTPAYDTWYGLMGWLRLVGSLKLQVSFAKEPDKRDYILQKRLIIIRSLLIVATPYGGSAYITFRPCLSR